MLKQKSYLKSQFDKNQIFPSPSYPPTSISITVDDKGFSHVDFPKVDVKKIVASNGVVSQWNLNNLLSAGINPDFAIHTSPNSRLDSMDDLSSFEFLSKAVLSDSPVSVEPVEPVESPESV